MKDSPTKTDSDVAIWQDKEVGRTGIRIPIVKWSPALARKILRMYRAGRSERIVAGLAGVCRQTLDVWKKTKPELSPDRVEAAKAIAEKKRLDAVNKIAEDEKHRDRFKANKFLLEVRNPQEYCPQLVVRGKIEHEHKVEINAGDSLKVLKEVLERYEERAQVCGTGDTDGSCIDGEYEVLPEKEEVDAGNPEQGSVEDEPDSETAEIAER